MGPPPHMGIPPIGPGMGPPPGMPPHPSVIGGPPSGPPPPYGNPHMHMHHREMDMRDRDHDDVSIGKNSLFTIRLFVINLYFCRTGEIKMTMIRWNPGIATETEIEIAIDLDPPNQIGLEKSLYNFFYFELKCENLFYL